MAIEQNNKCWTGKKERKKEVMVMQGRREIRKTKDKEKEENQFCRAVLYW